MNQSRLISIGTSSYIKSLSSSSIADLHALQVYICTSRTALIPIGVKVINHPRSKLARVAKTTGEVFSIASETNNLFSQPNYFG